MSEEAMKKPDRWTDEQWQAIIQKGKNLLVAAAAGSGKTSVLVERIIRKMTNQEEPVGVDQLLVVTFTNAAAAEMRHRIGEALKAALQANPQSAHLRKQLAYLQRATITTIHSFCLGLLRQHYYAVDLDPDFRIGDEMETELLRQDVLEAKLEEWYESDQAFRELADIMTDGQDDENLARLLLRLYDFSRSHPQPSRWLNRAAAMFALSGQGMLDLLPWTKSVVQAVRFELQGILGQLRKAALLAASPEGPAAYVPLLEQEQAAVKQAIAASREGWEALEQAVRGIAFARLPAVKEADPGLKEQAQKERNGAKDTLKKLQEEIFLTSAGEYRSGLIKMAPYMQTLARVVMEFSEAYQQAKQERALVDFNDLEHLALKVLLAESDGEGLQPSAVARELSQQFVEVLVDEYQDINLVQETILQLVSRDERETGVSNRFMVGDVKQSIYRFRLAEPRLFMEKYRSYETNPESAGDSAGVRIDLAANFRSRVEVVNAVNFLFRQIMSPEVGEIDYDKAAELIFRGTYADVEPERLAVELHMINRDEPEDEATGEDAAASESLPTESADMSGGDDGTGAIAAISRDDVSAAQLEGRFIAQRIRQWMAPGEGEKPLVVFDKEKKALRPLAYRDIVILLRATAGSAQPLMDELRAAGIPVYAEQSDGYFSATEVEVMLSLLKVIDNPLQDIPLAAVLRSPVVGITEAELTTIRLHHKDGYFYQAVRHFIREHADERSDWQRRLCQFFACLEEWRTAARQGSLADLIARIYRETGYVEYVTALENGQQRQANLRLLYDRARQYEATTYRGLFRFLRFVERLQQTGSDLGEARTIGESEDVVRMMTIHKSKGLEFPVVFVAGMGKQFNTMDMKSPFLLHKELGFGPYVVDEKLRLRYPSLAQLGIKKQLQREMLAEEMRILYVALTRAREKLILVGSAKQLADRVSAWCNQAGDGERLDDVDLLKAKGYLDWIGRALVRHSAARPLYDYAQLAEQPLRQIQDDSRWSFHLYEAKQFVPQTSDTEQQAALFEALTNRQPVPDRPADETWRQYIARQLEWQDQQQHAAAMAAKWTVSDLKYAKAANVHTPFKPPRITQKPRFLSGAEAHPFSAAELGTITHTVLQHLDLQRSLDEADIREQLMALVDRQLLTEEQMKQVRIVQLAALFGSPLGMRMRQAVRVRRELPFTMALPAHELSSDFRETDQEQVIVQGVIDCVLEEHDGKLVLLDFKTDALRGDSTDQGVRLIANRYREQIRLYRRAIRQIWQRDVDESYLYLFAADRAVLIE